MPGPNFAASGGHIYRAITRVKRRVGRRLFCLDYKMQIAAAPISQRDFII